MLPRHGMLCMRLVCMGQCCGECSTDHIWACMPVHAQRMYAWQCTEECGCENERHSHGPMHLRREAVKPICHARTSSHNALEASPARSPVLWGLLTKKEGWRPGALSGSAMWFGSLWNPAIRVTRHVNRTLCLVPERHAAWRRPTVWQVLTPKHALQC